MSSWIKQAVTAAAMATTVGAALPASADVFIKIGDIKGESADAKHKGESDVLSWSWGTSQAVSNRTPGAAAGKPAVHELVITKVIDSSSPQLVQAATTGKVIPEATLSVRIPGKGAGDFIRIRLKNVFVSSVKLSGASAQALPLEEISLSFAAIDYTVTPQTATGQTGGSTTMSYSVAGAK